MDLRRQGSVAALAGPNGNGKSTLLRVVVSLPPSPRALCGWRAMTPAPSSVRYGATSAPCPQKATFPGRFTVAETLAYAAWLQVLGARATRHRTTGLVSALGLEEHLNHSLITLPRGTRQRVCLVPHETAQKDTESALERTLSSLLADSLAH
ncbi:ATP-binding cassette domain-containing protein [Actinomyces sp. 2119]|uniref:ATP-binding cassette domain-containing protein n=1 Tax=Actinomyces sp. 2119 TaxID=2321393 RepID=UPI000E6C4BD3|nr:ATP-binding cassette domain-containing protein [Actinomyces sp. 2119]RJF43163.1 ATP-binding cassette domain-containing protein [Actinomyces sp. 2119]